MMWTQILAKLGLWLLSEAVLTVLGYDDLADCGEAMALAKEHMVRSTAYVRVVEYPIIGR